MSLEMPPKWLTTVPPACPRGLVNTLITDRARGAAAVKDHERAAVCEWLCYLGVDHDALTEHVALLKTWLPGGAFGDPLPFEVYEAVRARGPGAITDPGALAAVLLNANQLIQVHEAAYNDDDPDHTGPSPFWIEVIKRVVALDARAEPSGYGAALSAGAGEVAHNLLAHKVPAVVGPPVPGQAIKLIGLRSDPEGDALRAAVRARFYGPPADRTESFTFALHAESVPGNPDQVCLYLAASPAPVLAPLEVTLRFERLPGAPEHTFTIPVCPGGRPRASSVATDPLPRAAFEFAEGTWDDALPLRLTVRGDAPVAPDDRARLVRTLTFSAAVPVRG
ncbi:MAG: hypothetical protein FJ304_03765 [Planctomycetes bacterium]|nr:hypothetical protein [Planctomycetota bacterium]